VAALLGIRRKENLDSSTDESREKREEARHPPLDAREGADEGLGGQTRSGGEPIRLLRGLYRQYVTD
jgi:hypothetical protein